MQLEALSEREMPTSIERDLENGSSCTMEESYMNFRADKEFGIREGQS